MNGLFDENLLKYNLFYIKFEVTILFITLTYKCV